MALSSKEWAFFISRFASRLYFFLIILQIPLFRYPYRGRLCRSPIEITSSHFIANEIYSQEVVKALLFPGATVKAFAAKDAFPAFDNVLDIYKFTSNEKNTSADDIHHLEVIVGCYLCVAGALISVFKARRVSFIGILLVLWGVGKQVIRQNEAKKSYSFYSSTMAITVIAAFFSVRADVRKLIRSCTRKRSSKLKYL